jgi:hypothetical protein
MGPRFIGSAVVMVILSFPVGAVETPSAGHFHDFSVT